MAREPPPFIILLPPKLHPWVGSGGEATALARKLPLQGAYLHAAATEWEVQIGVSLVLCSFNRRKGDIPVHELWYSGSRLFAVTVTTGTDTNS